MRAKAEFDATISKVSDPARRIATFGAMLAKDSGLGSRLVIAGGSAITVYSHGQFTSEDVDVVGERSRISPVLKRWGFRLEEGEDGRPYWRRDDLGLLVDIIHRSESSGSGRSGVPRTFKTTEGPVRASAVEDLVVRRLVFWSRSGKSSLLEQAVLLFAENRDEIDLDYLEGEVKYEGVEEAYRELRERAG
ncbi:MAG: hypothetical protein WCB18_03215 [Thermoplasmata archaeon]